MAKPRKAAVEAETQEQSQPLPQSAPWAPPAQPSLPAYDPAALAAIVAGTIAAGFMYAPGDVSKVLEVHGFVEVAWNAPQDANGFYAVKATEAGIAAVPAAPANAPTFGPEVAQPAAAVPAEKKTRNTVPRDPNEPKPTFGFAVGVPMPEVVKFGKPQLYPFDQLSQGQAFFVANTASRPDIIKQVASTVNSANKRYEDRGFLVRRVPDGAAFGPEFAGKSGCGVWRTAKKPVKA